jgi:UPF0755 protein
LKRRLSIILVPTALLMAIGIAAFGVWLHSELETPYYGARAPEEFIDIPKGATANEIADILTQSGILKRRIPFLIYLRYADMGRQIRAGEYKFHAPETPKGIARRLVRGDVYFRSITIPEGFTARETIELLAENGLGSIAEMERALLRTDWIQDLDSKAKNLEGYLFPETYHFGRKTDSETIVKTMVEQFRRQISKLLKESPPKAGWNISRIVILASIIEKEVMRSEERPLVASVLINRLKRGIPLACDATIIYAMKLAGTYKGNLSKADLQMKSPYNSYLHPDLPPGPIANPGADSLRAALNPADTDYLYYVSRNDGTHQFSKNWRDHTKAVNKYQRPKGR